MIAIFESSVIFAIVAVFVEVVDIVAMMGIPIVIVIVVVGIAVLFGPSRKFAMTPRSDPPRVPSRELAPAPVRLVLPLPRLRFRDALFSSGLRSRTTAGTTRNTGRATPTDSPLDHFCLVRACL